MAITNFGGHRSELDDSSAMTRNVADDMAAIFGAGVRSTTEIPPSSSGTISYGKSRQPIGLAVAGLIAVTIAAGIFTGKSMTAAPAAAPTARVGARVQLPAIDTERGQLASLVTSAGAASPSAPVRVPVAPPVPTPRAAPMPENPASAVDQAAPQPVSATQSAAVLMQQLAPAVGVKPTAPPPPDLRRNSCDDDSDTCLASRIELADQHLDETFVQAAAAGVRRQELRDFMREWDRARTESFRQPRNALRRYATITSDLRDLADIAAAREGAAIR